MMQGVKAQLSLDEANRLQHSMRIFSSPSTRAGMSRCRLHAVLHTAAGKQDPRGWCCTAAQEKKRREKRKKTKEETAPFSVNLMRMPSFIPAQYCSSQEQRPTLTFRDKTKRQTPSASQSNEHVGPPFGVDKLAPRHVLPSTRVFKTKTAGYQ